MPTIMTQVNIVGANATNSGYLNVPSSMDLTHITVERTAPSIYQTFFELFLDVQRIYPTFGIGILGEKSEGVIHHHPLPRTRCNKGQVLEFRFTSAVLPTAACPNQSLIVTLVADWVPPDEQLKGTLYAKPIVVESYITENFIEGIERKLKELFGGFF